MLKPACSATKISFELGNLSYCTFQSANNKGPDQTTLIRRLVGAYVVCMQQNQVLSNILNSLIKNLIMMMMMMMMMILSTEPQHSSWDQLHF